MQQPETAKLIPFFTQLLHQLYRPYPGIVRMLVHMFIHTEKYTLAQIRLLSPACQLAVHKLVHNRCSNKNAASP